MNKLEPLLEYECEAQSQTGISVIVVAGGSSARMGQNKLLIKIGGLPVLVRTLKVFQQNDKIGNIILVASKENLLEYQKLCDDYMITKVSDIVEGGKSRQESVLCGIKHLKSDEDKLLIQDGARPFVTDEIIDRVIAGLDEFNAVVPAVKVKDTIKQIDENGVVIKTVNRDYLVGVQTPQGVNAAKYLKAIEGKDLSLFTDDVSILEAAGERVLTVEGDYKNIKITTPDDIIIAEAFLKGETFE